jgi:hypothetical protein
MPIVWIPLHETGNDNSRKSVLTAARFKYNEVLPEGNARTAETFYGAINLIVGKYVR